jgi:hypothetical protein
MRTKSVAGLVVLAVLVVVLAVSNPREDDFLRWFEGHTTTAVSEAKGVDRVIAGLTALKLGLDTRTSLRRENYVLLSVFRIRLSGREHAFIGVFGQFAALGG